MISGNDRVKYGEISLPARHYCRFDKESKFAERYCILWICDVVFESVYNPLQALPRITHASIFIKPKTTKTW